MSAFTKIINVLDRLAKDNYNITWLEDANRDARCVFGKEVLLMMPLSLAAVGEENTIRRIGGSPEIKKHLEDLGFVVGGTVTVLTMLNGNVIVRVKESRIAINDEMARRIMI